MSRIIQSVEAEAGLLGALVLDPLRLMPVAVRHSVTVEWFADFKHQCVWQALEALWNDRRPIDSLTLEEKLKALEIFGQAGGSEGVDALIDAAITAANGEYYLDLVRQKYILRQEVKVSEQVIREACTEERGDEHLKTIPGRYLSIIGEVNKEPTNAEVLKTIVEKFKKTAVDKTPAIGMSTPWKDLTAILCGLEPGITIIAARPSTGKTTLEDCISVHAAQHGIGVARVTLDSTRTELLQRASCRLSGVSLPKLKFGFARKDQLAGFEAAAEKVAKLPMYITDTERDIRGISSWVREKHMKHGIGLITLDFVQLVDACEMGRAGWDKVQKVSFVSSALKALSLELKVPMLVLSQLSRAIEKDGGSGKKGAGDRLPLMSDLRDSGSLEQDAHKILFLYQDQTRHKSMEESQPGATRKLRPVWFDLLKHKDGETARLPFWFYAPYFMFSETEENFPLPTTDEQKGLEDEFR
jgi:replicative DNA helicase